MSDRDYQLLYLHKIFDDATMAPCFKRNRKYPEVKESPGIIYADVMDKNYIIRDGDADLISGGFSGELDSKIIAEYKSLEELVDDGWRLD